MNRKSFLKTSALGMGALFQMPFSGEHFSASEMYEAFNRNVSTGRMYDVLIIGGSFAGLSAAMGLGRCLRSVLVIDEGLARNRTSPSANNLFSRDGQNPEIVRSEAKEQLQQYKEYLSIISGSVEATSQEDDTFEIQHADGSVYKAKHIVFASGVTDNLQEIDGLKELWGRGVYHCPYCHGWENRGKKTVVIGEGARLLGFASNITNWTDNITYFSQGEALNLPNETVYMLRGFGLVIREEKVDQISKRDDEIHIRLAGQDEYEIFEACYAPGIVRANSTLAESLGCEMRDNGSIEVDERYQSSVANVYAIGDVSSRSNGQVIHAAYSGNVVAAAINRKIIQARFSSS
ncbi:MAG: NAD(P)/FAD-dependent oxidoreductase [Balneolaceae bacterium]|nr:MAG: NAD(P)/FAD-dependent oxidoreductase [Balneolaceae bacterium]